MVDAAARRADVIMLLGVSGALVIPLVRVFSKAKIVTNIDGIEWRRDKWSWIARWFLRLSERVAVQSSHSVVADNESIAQYVKSTYGVDCEVIAYGGDHAVSGEPKRLGGLELPGRYALGLCRIEPENNVAMILEAFAENPDQSLVFVGNWDRSEYGRSLHARFSGIRNIYLLDPIYQQGLLRSVRERAWLYVHGHSAGGTNPSLVEMMHFGIPVFAYACCFNQSTTQNRARYFVTASELSKLVDDISDADAAVMGSSMREIARRRYTWDKVGQAYFDLLAKQ
jgi:glycosyltransferase involved in cell wall biosynthesis